MKRRRTWSRSSTSPRPATVVSITSHATRTTTTRSVRFIKSVRGSDPDGALYWLVTMLESGESPRFLARRLVILASEDIGLADPMGLVLADAAARTVEFIGLPEGRLTLAPRDARSRSPSCPRATRSREHSVR